MFWGQALIEFRRTNKARSWPNFRAWHLKTDSKSAFATSLVGSRSPPLTTSFGISAFDMSRGTHPPTLPMSSPMHHFPNRRPPDHRIARASGHDPWARRLPKCILSRSSLRYEERASRHRPRGNGHGSLSRKGKGQADAYYPGAVQRRAQNQGPAAVWPLERPRGYKRSGFLCSPLAPPPSAPPRLPKLK